MLGNSVLLLKLKKDVDRSKVYDVIKRNLWLSVNASTSFFINSVVSVARWIVGFFHLSTIYCHDLKRVYYYC